MSRDKAGRPLGLLVSVRDQTEAVCVDRSGVEILDVKEPHAGALGRADREVLEAIIESVGRNNLISAALGELDECESYLSSNTLPSGLSLAKCGLAFSKSVDWQVRVKNVWQLIRLNCRPVAVAYADWQSCNAPGPTDVLQLAIEQGLDYFLLDTYFKNGISSLELISEAELSELNSIARTGGVQTVLAGSISTADLPIAYRCGFDLVGVRGAVCDGSRENLVNESCVRKFRKTIDSLVQECESNATPTLSK